jgi:hypothetical protein
MTWLDDDARAGSVLTTSIEDHFAADIMEFERTHHMWYFLHQKYESIGQSTYLAAIRQSSFFNMVTLQLMISLINFLLFGVSLTLFALSCLLPLASPAEIRRLHLSFVGLMTF